MALVPPGVLTVTSTVPVPAGAITDRVRGERNVTALVDVAPNATVASGVNPVPSMMMLVLPDAGPSARLRVAIVGAGAGGSLGQDSVRTSPVCGGGTARAGVVTVV